MKITKISFRFLLVFFTLSALLLLFLRKDKNLQTEIEIPFTQSPKQLSLERPQISQDNRSYTTLRPDDEEPILDEHYTLQHRDPRPFAVTQAAGFFEWTAEDCTDPQIIRSIIAGSPAHAEILLKENEKVSRRQLVYLSSEFSSVTDMALHNNLPLMHLPGFDGEVFELLIDTADKHGTKLDENSGGLTGAVVDEELNEVGTFRAGLWEDHWFVSMNVQGREFNYRNRLHGELLVSEISRSPESATQESPSSIGL